MIPARPTAPTLQEAWLGGAEALPIRDDASVSLAREWVREEGARAGLGTIAIESMAIVVSELGRNQLAHAFGGQVLVRRIERGGTAGLEVVAADRGQGIADPARALAGGQSSAGTLGIGLAGALRQADEMDFDVRLGEGSCLWARKFAVAPPRRREVAVLGRPCDGEFVSGDDAAFLWVDGTLLLGLADGLGHGPAARDASARAVTVLREQAHLPPSALLGPCAEALAGTRGAVMALARIGPEGDVEHVCIGNIGTHLWGAHGAQRLPCQAGVLGAAGRRSRSGVGTRAALPAGDLLVMFTDGLASRVSLAEEPALRRQHPLLIADHLLRTFGRGHDDALVLVAR